MDEPSEPEAELEPAALPARRGPGAMMRFLVVVFGVLMLGTGRAVMGAGGIVGTALGLLIVLVAVVVIAIAVGLVEWAVRISRARASGRPG